MMPSEQTIKRICLHNCEGCHFSQAVIFVRMGCSHLTEKCAMFRSGSEQSVRRVCSRYRGEECPEQSFGGWGVSLHRHLFLEQ